MNRRFVTGLAVLGVAVTCTAHASSVEVTGIAHSQATDLNANPNSVDDNHSFDNTTAATTITPTTTSAVVEMAFGNASGTVTASEGLFQGLSTASYSNTGMNEASQTDVRAFASDLATITSATLPANTPVTVGFSLGLSGTLTSPDVFAGGAYSAFAVAQFDISQQFFAGNSISLTYSSALGAHNKLTGSFSAFVGEQLLLSQSMELGTYVSGSYQFTHPGTATVDFSHTVQFLGDSATAGATLVAASGHDYATPLPPSITVAKAVGVDSPIPGGAGNFTNFHIPLPPSISPQPTITAGVLAFVGSGPSGQQGIYLHSTSPLPPSIKVADLNTAIPGGTGNFTSFFTQVGAGGGNVVFGGNGSSGQQGIYAQPLPPQIIPSPPNISPLPPDIKVADLNTAIPGGTGNFTGFASTAPAASGGNVAFIGSGAGGQLGIYAQPLPPSIQPLPPGIKVADLNTAIPGGTGNFAGFAGSPALSGQNVAYIGTGSGGQMGIYALPLPPNIVPLPPSVKIADTNTTIPGTSSNFQFFSSLAMDPAVESSALAFVGGGTVAGQSFKGVYFEAAQPTPPPIKVADFSTAIPGGAGNFTDFGSVAFDPDSSGDHIFAFVGMGAGGQEGIYADVNNMLTKVVDLHDTLGGQTVLSLSLGAEGLDSGVLTFAATFADGTQALFTDNLVLPGDYNHDGVVDAADYVVWRNALGSTTDLAADGNGNGTIDSGDFDVWRAHFGQAAGSSAGAGMTAAVPEPATWFQILLVAALGLVLAPRSFMSFRASVKHNSRLRGGLRYSKRSS